MTLVLDCLDLEQAERQLCLEAMRVSSSIVEAAALLGITRHALKRRIIKHEIGWPPSFGRPASGQEPRVEVGREKTARPIAPSAAANYGPVAATPYGEYSTMQPPIVASPSTFRSGYATVVPSLMNHPYHPGQGPLLHDSDRNES